MPKYYISYMTVESVEVECEEEQLDEMIEYHCPINYGGDGIHIINEDSGEYWDE